MKTANGIAKFCGRAFLVLCLFVAAVPMAFAYDDPPFRVARLNFVEGEVSFQPAGETDWGWARVNRPMTAGDSLWTGDRSRAEMHIGSMAIRVGGQTSVSFLNLDDRTVQIQLNSGTVDLRVRNLYGDDVFEVDTPNLAFSVLKQGDYRITVDPDGSFTTITLREGYGQITGGGQAFNVEGGSQVQVSGTDYISYDIYDLPGRDNFDQWSYSRQLREERSQSARYVSPELTGYEDLDQNGIWRNDRNLGQVWIPTHVSRDWAPYREGRWAWVDPWGWTWVDDAPSGFVTSHYGRWAHMNDDGNGGGGWAWVPPRRDSNRDEREYRPVYSPALVTFVGDSNASRDFGSGGGVAWFALGPGEVYVPARQVSPTYVTNVNITNTVVQQTTITNVVNNNNIQTTNYVNQNVAGAVTAVPRATFVNAQPVAQAAVKVAPASITAAPAVHAAPVAPVKASVMGGGKESAANATAASAPPKPPPAVVARPVVAKAAPPPPPVAFAQKQQALQANPGKPLDAKAEQSLRAATPPPVVRVVKTAPAPATVKPVETAAKKPQPATSPNTAKQEHPATSGAPPAAAAADKSKEQAAQQAAADKSNQQAEQQKIAAEKAKQEQAAQQAAANKSNQQAEQQKIAAEKAKQDQAAQQAATEKSNQQAEQQKMAAEKAKQQAAQQASAEKAKQDAGQQRAAQLAAEEKAKQEAAQQQAAAEKAKQDAARQQASADATKREEAQKQAAAEKSRQQAMQQQAAAENEKRQAAQRAADDKARQQAAQVKDASERNRQESTRQPGPPPAQGNRPGSPAAVHPNELPAPPRPAAQPSANAELDKKHQQEQDQLRAKQEQDRQRVQQQQEQEHAKLAQQQADAAKKQLIEQQHQQQTQQLQQKHAEEQRLLAEKQKQERQNQTKPPKNDRPPQ